MKDPLLRKIAGSIRRRSLLRARDAVLVAVSGGPDSVALLAALVAMNRGGWRIGVAHVNHHLRGRESDRDQRFVERLAAKLGCGAHVVDARIEDRRNLEEQAREGRYRALHAVAARHRFRVIATGHTLDDQAETVLHRVIRGVGIGGLGGIHAKRDDGVIRPLLDVARREVLAFLRARRLRYRTDRTNASARFTRNRLRHRLLPLLERDFNPGIRRALARLAEVAREDEEVLESIAARHAPRNRGQAFSTALVRRARPAIQRRMLRQWLAATRGDLRAIELDHVERLRELALAAKDRGALSLPGGTVTRRDGRLHWNPGRQRARVSSHAASVGRDAGRDRASCRESASQWRVEIRDTRRRVRPSRWRAVFDLESLDGAEISVRDPRRGERIRPLGLGGSKKLQDVFVDAKVPRAERSSWPVVEAGGKSLWVPGLVRDERALVTRATRRFLVIEARRG